MRDTQKAKFYKFEDYIIKRFLQKELHDGLEFREIEGLVGRICHSYNVRPPKIKVGRQNSSKAYYKTIDHSITLPPWAQRTWTVVHETAHAITYGKGYKDPGHDGDFVGVWVELFSRMYDIPKETLESEVKLAGLRYVKFSPK